MPNSLRVLLLLLVLAAMWIAMARLATLGRDSLQFDEIQMLRVAGQPTDAAFEAAIPAGAAPLGYHILRAWGVEGRGDAALRVPAFLFGLLNLLPLIGFLYYALPEEHRRSFPLLAPLTAVMLMAHPLFWQITGRLTPDSLSVFLMACTALFGLLWTKSGRWGWSAAMTAAAILSLFTLNTALFSIAGIVIGLAIHATLTTPSFGTFRTLKGLLPVIVGAFLIVTWNKLSHGSFVLFPSESVVPGGRIIHVARLFLGAPVLVSRIFPFVLCLISMMWGAAAFVLAYRPTQGRSMIVVLWLLGGLTPLLFLDWAKFVLPPADHLTPFFIPLILLQVLGIMALINLSKALAPSRSIRWLLVGLTVVLPLIVLFSIQAGAISESSRQYPNYRAAVESLVGAPAGSFAFVASDEAKYAYEFYKDKRFHGAPEARVFDPKSQYQAELMLALDRVYIVDAGMRAGQGSGDTADDAARAFQQLVQLRGGRVEAWLPPLTVLKSYKVAPDIGPLPDDGVIPLGRGDGGGPFYIVRGFYKPEMWGDTEVRWAHPHSRVAAVLTPGQAARFTKIRLKGFAWAAEKDTPRTFELAVNGAPLGPQTMPALGLHTVEWPLPALQPGLTLLTITTPDDVPQPPKDPRTLSLAIYELSFQE